MNSFSPTETDAAERLVELALAEDLGSTGDRTSDALIPPDQPGRAVVVARSTGILAGSPLIGIVCHAVDPKIACDSLIVDGNPLERGSRIATLSGPLRSILIAERTVLNFLQRLSGIATLTERHVKAVSGTKALVLDTRKTTPGWRLLEKYAVRAGGGCNHRIGLYDGILIKDNHIAGLGDQAMAVARAVELARSHPGNEGLPVEIEVDTLDQLRQVLPTHPDIVLLDNMTLSHLCDAVVLRDSLSPTTKLEASGGVNLDTIRGIAETGVDRISVGALTHSAMALDIALDYEVKT